MTQATPQQIQSTQGTRLHEAAPWQTYAAEMDQKLDRDLAAAVAEYADRQHEENNTSSQTKEELHRQQEMSNDLAKQYQWLNPEDYADQEARIGRVMHSTVFFSKLRGMRVECWYAAHPQPQKTTLFVQRKQGMIPPEFGCWVQLGFMPELSIMRFDEHGVPLDERRRGWRTCLLQLILKGIVTEEEADKVFGKPLQSQAFHRYNSQLQAFRNAGGSLGE